MEWILLIDPFQDLLSAYRMFLEEEGYRVETATNLKDAYELFTKKRYSVILTEYISPFEATNEMIQRMKEEAPETFIIIVTNATVDVKTYEKLFAMGADDFILKPYPPEKVLVHIKKGLKQRDLILKMRELEKLTLVEAVTTEIQGLIFNPVFFKMCLRQEIKRARRHQRPLSLLLVEMPDKKEMGDRFEEFYTEFLKIIKRYTRAEDMVGKNNGEIGIILPETDRTGSNALIQRLLNLVHAHPQLKLDSILSPHIQTLSFQSFTYPDQFAIPESLRGVVEGVDKEPLRQ